MRRLLPLLALAAVLAACGSSSHSAATTTTAAATTAAEIPPPGPGTVLYQGGDWAVAVHGTAARAFHLAGDRWRADDSKAVRISILGPRGAAAATPQVAVELIANAPLVESGLWVDGVELEEKGGGLTPKRGTIYGAPATPLSSGNHVAVAYARTAAHATAVAWAFSV